jgi:hypothetical protein
MKAGAPSKSWSRGDYYPHFTYDFSAESIRIPFWVPDSVAEVVRGRRLLQYELLSLVRLTCDPQMRSVWRELSRRHRNGAFLYPAERQDAAMAELFSEAMRHAFRSQTVITRRQAEQRHRELMEKADELLADGSVLFTQAVNRDGYGGDARHGERWGRIAAAARALKEIAAENLAIEMRTALDRDRGDGQVRWFALIIAEKCRTLFRAPLYGVTATITSVALNRSITPRTVRQWCARHPADKTPQTQALSADY